MRFSDAFKLGFGGAIGWALGHFLALIGFGVVGLVIFVAIALVI